MRVLHDSGPEDRRPARQVGQRLRVPGHRHRRGAGAEVKSGRRRRAEAAEPGQPGQNPRRGRGGGHGHGTAGGVERGSAQDVVNSVRGGGGALLRRTEPRGQTRGALDPRGGHGHAARVGRRGGRGGGGVGPAGGQRVGRVQRGLHLRHAVQRGQRRGAEEEALSGPVHLTHR